jgi:Na+/H+-dicarboxylate symporter
LSIALGLVCLAIFSPNAGIFSPARPTADMRSKQTALVLLSLLPDEIIIPFAAS